MFNIINMNKRGQIEGYSTMLKIVMWFIIGLVFFLVVNTMRKNILMGG